MKISKDTIKRFIKEAVIGFILWTVCLTPYMWFIVGTTLDNGYVEWIVMQGLIVPPISVFVVRVTNYFCGKKVKCTECAVASPLTKLWINKDDDQWDDYEENHEK